MSRVSAAVTPAENADGRKIAGRARPSLLRAATNLEGRCVGGGDACINRRTASRPHQKMLMTRGVRSVPFN